MEAVIIANVARDDNPHCERQHAVNALRAAAQDVERNQFGPWNRPQFAYTNSGGTRILKDVNHLNEQVTNLTGAFRAERERAQRESERAQRESEALKQQLNEILENQRSTSTKWDWAMGLLHDIAIAISCRFIQDFRRRGESRGSLRTLPCY